MKCAASPRIDCAKSYQFRSRCFRVAGRITNITQNLWALQAAVPEVPATATTPATPAVPASYYPVPLSWTAGYDNRDRLTSFSRPGSSISYSYDANSNRLSSTDTTTSDTDLDGDFDAADLQRTTAQTPTIAQDSNRLLGWSQINTTKRLNTRGQAVTSSTSTQVNYGLDAAGNLTSDGLRTFSYDASNRLTQVQVGDADEASKVTYLHNAAGQRVFKSEPQVAQTAPSEAQLGADFITWLKKNFGWLFAQAQQNATLGQSYVYGDGPLNSYNLLGEYGNGGTKSAGRMEYIYLPTESGQAQLIGLYKNNRFYAVHTDHLGTPRLITDNTNKVVWHWAYSAFGDNKPTGILKATTNPKAAITNQPKLLQATSPSFPVNLRFPGQYWDDESRLSYNINRNYQPPQGRYTQPDPIGLEGGWSRFAYVGGNALSYLDPLGLSAKDIAEAAKRHIGERGWGRPGWKGGLGWVTAFKCNEFVNQSVGEGNEGAPLVNGRPATAGELGDPKVVIPGWNVVTGPARDGDIVAIAHAGEGYSGHTGIVVTYNGKPYTISANSGTGTITWNDWGFRAGQQPVIRRCTCGE